MLRQQIQFLIWLILIKQNCGQVTLTSVVCTAIDKNFCRFDLCELKGNTTNAPALSVTVRLLQVPVTNCLVRIELRFLSSKQSPNLINNTWDACNFMKNREKSGSLRRLYNFIKDFSNLNHSCPYNHDIYLDKYSPPMSKLRLPIPNGEFLVKTTYIVGNKERLSVDVSFKLWQ